MHSARTHLLALTALCAVVYFAGLTTHGLTNWQEGQRALVARDMHAQGSWIVPTVNGRPYLAKPPMIYWAQLALAGGSQPSEFHLRLTVALAGLAGVLGTYFVARRNLPGGVARSPMGKTARSEARDGAPGEFGAWSAGNMALWSAALLATGILYVRSSRIGELDILLVPFTVAAIGGVYAAWARHLDKGRTYWWAVALAAIAAAGAGLSKGPPAILVIALGAYGGIALWAAFSPEAGGGRGGRLGACFRSYARTHPVAVLGLPFLALWLWGRAVAARVGPATEPSSSTTPLSCRP